MSIEKESSFEMLECNRFDIVTNSDLISDSESKCYCGRSESQHSTILASQTHGSRDRWTIENNTIRLPTNAHGQVKFRESQHMAKYLRLAYDTKPEKLYQHFLKLGWNSTWPLGFVVILEPRQSYELDESFRAMIVNRLHNIVTAPRACILTNGLATDITSKISESLRGKMASLETYSIGFMHWGSTFRDHKGNANQRLIGVNKTVDEQSNPFSSRLCSQFLLADDGTVMRTGFAEDHLRDSFLRYMLKIKDSNTYKFGCVAVLINGDLQLLKTAVSYLLNDPPIRLVICRLSGGISSFISKAFDALQIQTDDSFIENNKEFMKILIQELYPVTNVEDVLNDLKICWNNRCLIEFFSYKIDSEHYDWAVLFGNKIVVSVLRSHFNYSIDLLNRVMELHMIPEIDFGLLEKKAALSKNELEFVLTKLLIADQSEILEIFLRENLNEFQEFITVAFLEKLYNVSENDKGHLVNILRRLDPNISCGYTLKLRDIGLIIRKLLGDTFKPSYLTEKLRSNDIMTKPFHELFLWAVLTKREKLGLMLWRFDEERLARLLGACKLCKSLETEAFIDDSDPKIYKDLKKFAQQFESTASQFLDYLVEKNYKHTKVLLMSSLNCWSGETCMSLAVASGNLDFLVRKCSQEILDDCSNYVLKPVPLMNFRVLVTSICPILLPNLSFLPKRDWELLPQLHKEFQVVEKIRRHDDTDRDKYLRDLQPFRELFAPNDRQYYNHCTSNLALLENNLNIFRKLKEFYAAPVTKYCMNTFAYLVFIALASQNILQVLPSEYITASEYYTLFFVFGLLSEKAYEFQVSDSNEMWTKFAIWSSNLWNPLDLVFSAIHFNGFLLRLESGLEANAHVLYSIACCYWIIRIMDFLNIVKAYGTLVILKFKVLKKIIPFFLLFAVFLLCFGVFRTAVLTPRTVFDSSVIKDIILKPYFMIYGETFPEEIFPKCGENPDQQKCVPFRSAVPISMAAYFLMTTAILMNTLIAYLNHEIDQIDKDSIKYWKFQRYNMIMTFKRKPILPLPFALFWYVGYFAKKLLAKSLHKAIAAQEDYRVKIFLSKTDKTVLNRFEIIMLEEFLASCRLNAPKTKEEYHESLKTLNEKIKQKRVKIDKLASSVS